MYTQCPHCLTLFRITSDQLKAAKGQARCCQCNQVFNALQHLRELPKSFTNTSSQKVLDLQSQIQHELAHNKDRDSGLVSDSEVERTLDNLADESSQSPTISEDSNLEDDPEALFVDTQGQLLYEQNDGLETEPDYFAADTESQMSELLDKDTASHLLFEAYSKTDLAEIIELDIPETSLPQPPSDDEFDSLTEKPDIPTTEGHEEEKRGKEEEEKEEKEEEEEEEEEEQELKEEVKAILENQNLDQDQQTQQETEQAFNFEPIRSRRKMPRSSFLWMLGSVLLLLPLSGQIAWQMRGTLIHHNMGKSALELICIVANCDPPVRQAINKINIKYRALTAHPNKTNTLLMQLDIINEAPFAQPFPKLRLSLFNNVGMLIARRTFTANEYLDTPPDKQDFLPQQRLTHIELELVDPGSEVTNFEFEFL
jgi:predicted Zn finger-like uncharacterized protein